MRTFALPGWFADRNAHRIKSGRQDDRLGFTLRLESFRRYDIDTSFEVGCSPQKQLRFENQHDTVNRQQR